MYRQHVTPDLEFLTDYGVFEKASMIRRVSDIGTKIVDASTMIFPKNPMFHVIDNVAHSDASTDDFDIQKYPFITTKNNVKYIHHFQDFESVRREYLNKFSHRIYRPKLNETLRGFSMMNRKKIIPINQVTNVLDNKNIILVENYNPLYRIITTGNRPIHHYYRYKAIFATVLAHITKYDRQHFLTIPVPDNFIYDRTNILALLQNDEPSGQKLQSTNHFYFFIIDLVALLLDNESKLSTFNTIPKRELSQLNIFLLHNNQAVLFNLGKLASLVTSKSHVFTLLNTISKMSGISIVQHIEPEENEESTLPVSVAPELPVVQDIEVPEEDDQERPIKTPTVIEKPVSQVIEPIQQVIEPSKEPLPPLPETEEDTRIITKDKILSPKQKERIEVLENKYKDIVVTTPQGPKTLDEILTEKIDTTVKSIPLNVPGTDAEPYMCTSSTVAFEKGYVERLLRHDIIASITAFSENGLYLTEYEERNEYNSFNRVKHIRAVFHDINGKRHTVNFKLPMPDDEGYYLVNGIKLSMSKQFVNIPICKISPTRVSLISNYNKTLVDKVSSKRHSLPEYLAAKATELNIKIIPKTNSYVGIKAPYEYKQLGNIFGSITSEKYYFTFEYTRRESIINAQNLVHPIDTYEDMYGVLIGKVQGSMTDYVFMNMSNLCSVVNIESNNIIVSDTPITDLIGNVQVPNEWCNLKILDKNIPIIFILAYRYGLSKVIKNLRIPYRLVRPREQMNLKSSELVIQFADVKLIINRYPLRNSYLVSGFNFFNTLRENNISDFDGKDVYYKLLSDKGMSTNYLKGIDNYFSFFIDPITKDILQQMGEPTNTRDLLIRAVDMLINTTDRAPSSLANFRLRSAEKLPAMIYNEISRQYANYVNSNYKDVSFSINTEAIFQRIVQDQTMGLKEERNPIHSMKEVSRVTYTGFGGRSSEAFVAKDRKYPDDAIGVLAETTTDSGSVGMVGALTADPLIKNLRGMLDTTQDEKTLANIVSDDALLIPGALQDDSKRKNFLSIQLSHHIPTPNQKPMRLRTGYEQVIPAKSSDMYAGKAKMKGVVTDIDIQSKLITVTYANGVIDIFPYGDIPGDASGMTINHAIDIIPDLQVGQKVVQGQILTFHKDFFQYDPITRSIAWCHGTPATVAIMAKDITLEDSNMISAEFAELLEFDSIYIRPIQLSTDMVVESFMGIGSRVTYNDTLIKLKYEDTADIIGNVDELFDDLKQIEYKSKHEGEIVDIQVYHVAESMNPSLTRFVNKTTLASRKLALKTHNTLKEEKYTLQTRVPNGTRIRGIELDEQSLLVVFHIKSRIKCGIGDKILFDSSLKTVTGKVEHRPMETEDGRKLDAIFSANSVFNRIVISPFIGGISDMILEHAENDIIKMYFDDHK